MTHQHVQAIHCH